MPRQQVPLDPEPFEDADTGNRFSVEQARVITKLLQYRPRPEYGYAGDRASYGDISQRDTNG
jgi:hypothetical protein